MAPNHSSEAAEQKQFFAGLFDRASSTYDHVGPNFFSHFGRRLVEHAALPTMSRVLDVACGRGAVLFPAAEAVGHRGSVIGIDFAEGMVKETSREISHQKLTNVEIHQMDAEHLDFPNSSFDAILCGFALFFFPQLERAMAEFRRTLRPGGHIAVSTWGEQFDKDWEWFYKAGEKYLPPKPVEQTTPDQPDDPNFATSAGMENIMRAAGFADVQIINETTSFHYSTKDEWWETVWSHGARALPERIERTGGTDALAQFKRDCFVEIEAKKSAAGYRQVFQVLYSLGIKTR